jgi:hypothetical protein
LGLIKSNVEYKQHYLCSQSQSIAWGIHFSSESDHSSEDKSCGLELTHQSVGVGPVPRENCFTYTVFVQSVVTCLLYVTNLNRKSKNVIFLGKNDYHFEIQRK